MSLRSAFAELFVVGCDILASTISSTGEILVQIGDAINSSVDSDSGEWWQHTGFRSMPANPTQGAASCQELGIRRGNYNMLFASKDTRHAAMWSDLNPDEAELFSFSGNCRVVVRKDGSVEIGTKNPQDYVALASLVKGELQKIATAFETFVPGSGGANFPQPYTTPGNIASTIVKAS